MLYCTQCRVANYCSRECQVADWPEHKNYCISKVALNSILRTLYAMEMMDADYFVPHNSQTNRPAR
eukprot:scaffold35642_cov211-Skeletonema_dohrnii-CCMP3373.AAC.1